MDEATAVPAGGFPPAEAPVEPMGAWTCELLEGRADWSAETWNVLGLEPGSVEPSLEAYLDRVHPDDRAAVLAAVEEAVSGEAGYDLTVRIVRPDGDERVARSQAVVVRDDAGAAVRLVGTVLDVTEIRRATAELERRRHEYETLVSHAPDVIVRFDRGFRHAYINRTRTLKVTPSEVVGRTQRELGMPTHVADAWEAALAQVFATGEELDFEIHYDVDGRTRWFANRLAPEHVNGTVETVLAVVREVTDQRLAERRFRAVVEGSQDLVSLLDADGTFTYVSPSFETTLGYTSEELIGTPSFALLHPDDLDRVKEVFRESVELPGAGAVTELRYRHRDGSWRHLESLGTNLLADPSVGAVVVSSRDVTDRKRLEDQLRQAQRLEAVGQLAGGIAHDFNNILLVIRGYCQLLAERLAGTEAAEDVAEIQGAAERATDLVRQLLAYGRRQRLEPVEADLNEIVVGVTTFLERLIGEDVRLRTELEPGLPAVRVDAAQLEQALVNLVANARDAMPQGGNLAIATSDAALDGAEAERIGVAPGRYVALSVGDTGHGMDEATLPHVFEPFFTTKPEGSGTGLGLAMVYGLLAQSGGGIAVESAPGRGSTFTLYVPHAEAGAARARQEVAPEPVSAGRGSERILLVEDEDQVRGLVAQMLRGRGYDVVDAARAADALEVARDGRIDLLVTDVVMPEMGGLELARRLQEEHPGVRVLLMSGYAATPTRAGDWTERVPLLQKPFGPAELARAVRDALDTTAA